VEEHGTKTYEKDEKVEAKKQLMYRLLIMAVIALISSY
jgi:hypothetical protein